MNNLNIIKNISLSLLLLSSSACAFMPSVGPHANFLQEEIKKKQTPLLFDLTIDLANKLSQKVKINENAKEKELLKKLLEGKIRKTPTKIYSGDQVRLMIWTQGAGQIASSGGGDGGAALSPRQYKMGIYSVDMHGQIDVPYAGLVNISGRSFHDAQRVIRTRLERTHLFESVEVSLQYEVSHGQNIVILGAVNRPSILNWNEGGISLLEAIAQAGGYINGEPLHGSDLGLNILLSRNETEYNIPLRTTLIHNIYLQPGDKIAVQHKPNVRVLCLGAGWNSPRMVPFSQIPSLSEVLAAVGGLNPQTAQGRAIFILKKDQSRIYKVNFDRLEGMEASQVMPIEDGDMIYAPVSRSVTMQQILSMFMFIAGQGMSAAAVK